MCALSARCAERSSRFSISHIRAQRGQLVVPSRRALVEYVLQRYQIDHRNLAVLPEAQQLVVSNLKELKPWLLND